MGVKIRLNKSLFEGEAPVQNNQAVGNQQPTNNNAAQPQQPAANNNAQQQPVAQQPANNAAQQQPVKQQPQEKVPEVKPQIDVKNAAQAAPQNLIGGCLSGIAGLLNRQDAGGVYLKAIANSQNASEELKKAASAFAAINSQDTNAVIQGFVTFANACSVELQKMQNNAGQQQ